MAHQLTSDQAKKFAEGYNAMAKTWNTGASDGGKSPFRANTWADLGYSAARSTVVKRQIARELNIVVATITAAQAQTAFETY